MTDQSIAVIGLSCRLPGARDLGSLWRNLLAGRVSSTKYTVAQLKASGVSDAVISDENFVPIDSRLDDVDQFDPDLFGFSQREAELLDPQHRLLLECAWELAQTTGLGNQLHRPRVGIFAGCSMNSYLPNVIGEECDLVSHRGTELMLTNDKDYMCPRISFKLGFRGPSVTVQTGCSSSLTAVHMGIQSLLLGECEVAFAGGVSVHAYPRPGYRYHPDLMFSRDGTCRPFDEEASGTFFGDGAGLVALRPLDDALRNGDVIRAVILGSAINNDGAARAGFTAPGVEGQRDLILDTLSLADVDPGTLGMVEAHGTGTRLGDPIEFEALRAAFSRHTRRRNFCALGSVKANLGHLAAAAGIAGLARVIASLEGGWIPPHPSFRRASREVRLDESPFFINTQPSAWPAKGPRRAGLSSLGAGGSNVHMILQQAPVRAPRSVVSGWRAIPLSARDPEAVEHLARDLCVQLRVAPYTPLDEVARVYAEGRSEFPWRTTFNVTDSLALADTIEAKQYEIAEVGRQPGRLWIDLGPQLLEAASREPDFRREMERLLAETPGARAATANALSVPRGNLASSIMDRLETVCAIRCLRRWVLTPTSFLIPSRDQAVIDCAEGRLTVAELVSADERREPLAPGSLGPGYRLRDYEGDAPEGMVLSLESDTRHPDTSTSLGARQSALRKGLSGILGELWCRGFRIDWSALRAGSATPLRTLPVAPMRHRRCWFEVPPAASLTHEGDGDRVYVEHWERLGRLSAVGRTGSMRHYRLLGRNGVHLAALGDVLRSWDHVVTFDDRDRTEDAIDHLVWQLDDEGGDDPAFAWELCELVKQWAVYARSKLALTLVGSGFVNTFGEEATKSGRAAALACVAAINQEMPSVRVNVLDVSAGVLDQISQANAVAKALMLESAPPVLALRRGIIFDRRHIPLAKFAPIERGGHKVCLVTGGLGTVGFGMARYIARTFHADLVVLRNARAAGLDLDAQQQERLNILRGLGGRVEVIQADVCDASSLFEALRRACELDLQPNCFVHAAGLSGSRTVQWLGKTSRSEWQELMDPKARGAQNLHAWFETRTLQFGCFVSSLAVLAGGLGLAPYAAASAACSAGATANGERSYFAIDWDGWEGWDTSRSVLYDGRRSRPLNQVDVERVLDAVFAAHMHHDRFVISTTPLQERLASAWGSTLLTQGPDEAEPSDVAEQGVEERMAALWRAVLRCSVEPRSNFFDLGGDSLIGVELIRKVNAHFKVSLSMVDLFESASVAALSETVEDAQARSRSRSGGVA